MSISNAEYNLVSAQWLEQFNRTIKQNPHDQFSALICDLESCESRQRELLHNLLFRNHNSARFWFEYCKFIVESFPQRKLQLQRLVNKAFNFINEVENRDDKHFVQLHLLSAKLKPDIDTQQKYFQNTIGKRSIGSKYANVYLVWAETEMQVSGVDAAIDVLKKGLELKAEPKQKISNRIKHLQTAKEAGSNSKIADIVKLAEENTSKLSIGGDTRKEMKTTASSDETGDSDIFLNKAKAASSTSKDGSTTLSGGLRRSSRGQCSQIPLESEVCEANSGACSSSRKSSRSKAASISTPTGNSAGVGSDDEISFQPKAKAVSRDLGSHVSDLPSSTSHRRQQLVIGEQSPGGLLRRQKSSSRQKKDGNGSTLSSSYDTTTSINAKSARSDASSSFISSCSSSSNGGDGEGEGSTMAESEGNTRSTDTSTSSSSSGDDGDGNTIALGDLLCGGNVTAPLAQLLADAEAEERREAAGRRDRSSQSSSRASRSAKRKSVQDPDAGADTVSEATATVWDPAAHAHGEAQATLTKPTCQDSDATIHDPVAHAKAKLREHDPDATIHDSAAHAQARSRAQRGAQFPRQELLTAAGGSSSSSAQKGPLLVEMNDESVSIKLPAGRGKPRNKRVSFASAGAVDAAASAFPSAAAAVAAFGEHCEPPQQRQNQNERPDVAVVGGVSTLAGCRQVAVNGVAYSCLGLLGKGGSSSVHRVIRTSALSGSGGGGATGNGEIYAFKRVDIRGSEDGDEVLESYANEIKLLQRLKGSRYIIDLVDSEVNKDESFVSMIMEAGEVDLAKVLVQKQKQQSGPLHPGAGETDAHLLNPFFARMVWQEMLEAVDYIHNHKIIHGDLKPANFVFVKGHLKLIDFGIAKAMNNDTTNIYRDSQIGTVNYMAPEAIAPYFSPSVAAMDSAGSTDGTGGGTAQEGDGQGAFRMRLGRPSDIWSLGCILYQMIFGRPPFAALHTIQKLHAIPNPAVEILYPPHPDQNAIASIRLCLERDPKARATIRDDPARPVGGLGLLSQPYLRLAAPTIDPIGSSSQEASVRSLGKEQVCDVVKLVMQKMLVAEVAGGATAGGPQKRRRSAAPPPVVSSAKLEEMCQQVWGALSSSLESQQQQRRQVSASNGGPDSSGDGETIMFKRRRPEGESSAVTRHDASVDDSEDNSTGSGGATVTMHIPLAALDDTVQIPLSLTAGIEAAASSAAATLSAPVFPKLSSPMQQQRPMQGILPSTSSRSSDSPSSPAEPHVDAALLMKYNLARREHRRRSSRMIASLLESPPRGSSSHSSHSSRPLEQGGGGLATGSTALVAGIPAVVGAFPESHAGIAFMPGPVTYSHNIFKQQQLPSSITTDKQGAVRRKSLRGQSAPDAAATSQHCTTSDKENAVPNNAAANPCSSGGVKGAGAQEEDHTIGGRRKSSGGRKQASQKRPAMPLSLKDQIQRQASAVVQGQGLARLNAGVGGGGGGVGSSVSSRAEKWMRPKSPEKMDMRSAMERKLTSMRKFIGDNSDDDDPTDTDQSAFF